MNDKITIRRAVHEDIDAICSLYYDTVRNVNVKDYTREQIEVWSAGGLNKDNRRRNVLRVTESGERIHNKASAAVNEVTENALTGIKVKQFKKLKKVFKVIAKNCK